MIEGIFSEKCELYFEVELVTGDGLNISVDALMDTGFTEFLAINSYDIESLKWRYFGTEDLVTAQGIISFNIYVGKIIVDGQEYEVPVYCGKKIKDVLLGTQWFQRFDLIAKYRQKELFLIP